MSVQSRLVARFAGLRPAVTHQLTVERGVRVPAPDGVELITDLYLPRLEGPLPSILVRSPYGRGTPWGTMAEVLAERGYNVVLQSCRGTFGSGGSNALAAEAGDGRAAADWVVEQRWSNGELGTFGPSYLSFVQWALASTRPPQLKAMAIQIMAADRRRSIYPGGSFALDTALTWTYAMAHQEERGSLWQRLRAQRREREELRPAFAHLPLEETDVVATGRPAPLYREWLRHDEAGDPYWGPLEYSRLIPDLGIPVSLVGGWHDYYLPYMLEDHAGLVAAGAPVRLTVGEWVHGSPGGMAAALRQGLDWFDTYLKGARVDGPPVRVAVGGGGGWRELASWPPRFTATPWYVRAGGGLGAAPSEASEPDGYRYDPADPTPALGGTSLSSESGPRDNRPLEARDDVLSYTSAELVDDLEVMGPVVADLHVSSSLEHTDFFVRLCDVEPRGRSMTVCDGLLRLRPGQLERDRDGVARIRVELWPTAFRFRRGHRLRVLVASGAHPRFVRNPGSGEPLATATTLVAADQRVYHDPDRPSAIVLPVVS